MQQQGIVESDTYQACDYELRFDIANRVNSLVSFDIWPGMSTDTWFDSLWVIPDFQGGL